MRASVIAFQQRSKPTGDEFIDSLIAELNLADQWQSSPATPLDRARDCIRVLNATGHEIDEVESTPQRPL